MAAEPCVSAVMTHEPVVMATEEMENGSDGYLVALLDDTKRTGDERLSEKLNEDENDQDKVESEGKKKTGEPSLDALDWSDKNQLNEKDEFETKNTRSNIIKIKEHENSTSQRATKDMCVSKTRASVSTPRT